MKLTTPAVILLFSCFEAMVGCSNDGGYVFNPFLKNDLMFNGSFEMGGIPSFAGWTVLAADSSFVTISTDVPPTGVLYSARLRNQSVVAGKLIRMMPASSGQHTYRLRAWAKTSSHSGHGFMSVGIRKDTGGPLDGVSVTDSVWSHYEYATTVTAGFSDSLFVYLSGDWNQFADGCTWFTSVTLEKSQ